MNEFNEMKTWTFCKLQEFSRFGKINRCRLVKDIITNISRGYAFIEYETEKAAKKAVDRGDKMVIDAKMILVDHECERLLPGWIPRRLGDFFNKQLISFSHHYVSFAFIQFIHKLRVIILGGGFGGKKESGQLRFGGKDKPFAKPIQLMEEYELRKQLSTKARKT